MLLPFLGVWSLLSKLENSNLPLEFEGLERKQDESQQHFAFRLLHLYTHYIIYRQIGNAQRNQKYTFPIKKRAGNYTFPIKTKVKNYTFPKKLDFSLKKMDFNLHNLPFYQRHFFMAEC